MFISLLSGRLPQVIINSTITPNMTFTKTSQKFGQWADSRANTVFGLGFSSELQLTKVRWPLPVARDLQRGQEGGTEQDACLRLQLRPSGTTGLSDQVTFQKCQVP